MVLSGHWPINVNVTVKKLSAIIYKEPKVSFTIDLDQEDPPTWIQRMLVLSLNLAISVVMACVPG